MLVGMYVLIIVSYSSLHRLVSSPLLEYKAADCHAQLMLHSIYGVFKSLLGPGELAISADTPVEKVSSKSKIAKCCDSDQKIKLMSFIFQ